MILEKLNKQTPHPTRHILKKYGVSNFAIGKYLNLTPNYVANILSGQKTIKKHDKKLWKLVNLVKKEYGDAA